MPLQDTPDTLRSSAAARWVDRWIPGDIVDGIHRSQIQRTKDPALYKGFLIKTLCSAKRRCSSAKLQNAPPAGGMLLVGPLWPSSGRLHCTPQELDQDLEGRVDENTINFRVRSLVAVEEITPHLVDRCKNVRPVQRGLFSLFFVPLKASWSKIPCPFRKVVSDDKASISFMVPAHPEPSQFLRFKNRPIAAKPLGSRS